MSEGGVDLERLRVGDLVEVPAIDTVVRLADRADARARGRLLDAFVPTEEATRAIAAVGRRLRAGEGSLFVLGGYGSGKSHLLAVLAEAGEGRPHPAAAALWSEGPPPSPPPLAVAVPLVEQAAGRPLEEILLEAVAGALGASPAATAAVAAATRPERWQGVGEALRAGGRGGLLLLIDELSSYLRAKPTRPALREDVRLLQYLGEFRAYPLCVVATMQETIEAAARPEPEVSQRLRDRYATVRLTGAHLEEVVARRIIGHRVGAEAAIAAVRARLVEALGALPCTAERFDRLYPVYPPTLEHLDAMRHHLSAARGALDFVYRRLVGDPDVGAAPLLEAPATRLITPDDLFEHFATRLVETPDTAPLVERVDALYRLEGERLFGADAPLARRIARYLCVEAAGARPRERTADEVARALAVVGGSIDPGLGRLEVAAVLDRMVEQGAYVTRSGPDGARRYRVDAEADAALVVDRRLAALVAGEGEDEEVRVVDRLLGAMPDDPALPVATLAREREATRTLVWERSERRGTIRFGPLEDVGAADVAAWLEELERPGRDFVLVVAAPRGPAGHARARAHLESTLIPAARGAETARAVLWWLAAPVGDMAGLRRADALLSLEEELSQVADDASERALSVVREEKRTLWPRVVRQILDAVYAGEVILGQGDTLGRPEALRVLPFATVVERLVASALTLRHPDHRLVMARGEAVSDSAEEALYARFFPQGESEAPPSPPLAALLDGVLAPLGLAVKHGRAYRLVTDPARSPALAALAGALAAGQGTDDAVSLDALGRALAKGRLGLDARAIRLTVAAAVFGGLAVPVSGGRRVPLGRLTGPEALDRIDALRVGGGGEGGRVPDALARLSFLADVADGPYLPAKQRELWARAVKWKAERGDPAAEAEALADLGRHPMLASWRLERAVADLAAAGRLVGAIQVSLAPADGLARLERAAAELGDDGPAALTRAEGWSTFVQRELRPLLEAHRYLSHPAFDALDGQGDDGRALAAERRALIAALTEAPGLVDAGARRTWREAYDRFVAAYRERYARAHRSAVGQDPAPALAALERRQPTAARDPRAVAARAAVLARHCALPSARALEVEPVCPCGYRLGDPPLTQAIAAFADLLASLAEPTAPAAPTGPALPPTATAASGGESEGTAPAPTAVAPSTTAGAAPPTAPARGIRQRRSLAALAAALGPAGGVTARELRRRFERWLAAADDDPVELEP